ncbi:MAG: hypothetical protein LBK99_18125 [Opitutaceae bacterium]|jgi:hypothetical protein|nr:hypothetical protein [Opitutaceae bacterium]
MKHSKYILSPLMVIAGVSPFFMHAQPVMIDNFDGYIYDESKLIYYVQNQNTSWTVSAKNGVSATTDGIYSVRDGQTSRGADFFTNWAAGNLGFVRYTFASAQAYRPGTVFTVDLAVVLHSSGIATTSDTLVAAQIANGDPTLTTTSVWSTPTQTLVSDGNPISTSSYTPFSFRFDEATASLVGGMGNASLTDVLGSVTSITLVFTNSGGVGRQIIYFDNLAVTPGIDLAVPEVSTTALLFAGIVGGAVAARRLAGRRRPAIC